MKVLALIPARGGSDRLPRKNMMDLDGIPLVGHAVLCAIGAGESLSGVYVSSEDAEIINYVSKLDCSVIVRPARLAQSDTPSIDVVRHVIELLPNRFDAVLLLQPTSPLCIPADIRNAIGVMEGNSADAVISVTHSNDTGYEVGHAGRLRPVKLSEAGKEFVVPNGAVFLITTAALDEGLDWWSVNYTVGYWMPRERSIDIDTIEDFEMAKVLIESRQKVA